VGEGKKKGESEIKSRVGRGKRGKRKKRRGGKLLITAKLLSTTWTSP